MKEGKEKLIEKNVKILHLVKTTNSNFEPLLNYSGKLPIEL
jgi:hypothetical protein